MKGTRYSGGQIVRILDEIDSGKTVMEICPQYQVAETTVYYWHSKYRGIDQIQLHGSRSLK